MPPKKEKEKAAPKEVIIDEYNLTLMTLPELQGFVYRLQGEIEKARSALNFFLVEKDRIEGFWDITRKELEEKNALILSKCKEIEDLSRQYEEQKTNNLLKLKYIEYEKERKNEALKQTADELLVEATKKLKEEKKANQHKLEEKQVELQDMQQNYEGRVAFLNVKRSQFKKDIICHREEKLKDTIRSYEVMYEKLKDDLNLLKDVEVHEYEEQKRSEHREYLDGYIKSAEEMKDYFQGVVGGSLALIDVMKTEIKALRQAEDEMKANRRKYQQENEMLQYVNKEARSCNIQLAHFEQDRKSNAFTEKRIKEYLKRIKDLESENKSISQKFDSLSKERENLEVKFVSKLRHVEEGLRTKNTILQEKIDSLVAVLVERGESISSLALQPVDFTECYDLGPK